ncbi:MAG TPA: thiamine pyrophosphate-binding protein [Chloroflexota bacterium]|nr:thiamine pyrophosphate-binding protein [Chloroflexota bacterium]
MAIADREVVSGIQAGEAILQVLRDCGVEDIFSSPGSDWPAIWEALARRREEGNPLPRFVNCRHEELAVAMAAGYYRASGKLPAVVLHTGVGVLHGAMPIHTARQDGIPMVILAGDSSAWGEDAAHDPGGQWLHSLSEPGGPSAQAAPYTKWAATVGHVDALPGMVEHACRVAMTAPMGPTILSVPMEVSLAEVRAELVRATPVARAATRPPAAAIEHVARLLVDSRSPLIVTEYAGREPGNLARLVELAERLAIPVVEASVPTCTNFPSDHPLHVGYDAKPHVDAADVALLIGVRAPWHPASRRPANGAQIIVMDESPGNATLPTWNYPVDLFVPGSLDLALDDLNAAVKALLAERPASEQILEDRRRRAAAEHKRQVADMEGRVARWAGQTPLRDGWVLSELAELLPDDAVVLEETTTTHGLVNRCIPRRREGDFYSRVTGGLGVVMCQALGVKHAQRDKLVVSLMGDGAFYYNPVLACLGLAQEENLPTLTLVFDNHSYVAMEAALLRYYPEGSSARTGVHFGGPIAPETDYSGLARLYGGFGARVERPEQLRPAIEQALREVRAGKLAIIHLVVAADFTRGG